MTLPYDFRNPSFKSPKAHMLREWEQKWITCQKCEILACSTLRTIVGEGSPDSVALAIGEAPGAVESVYRRPFVGPAGKILRQTFLKDIEEYVFVTNILACRAPFNRKALLKESNNCKARLDELRAIFYPPLIAVFGDAVKAIIAPDIPERGVVYTIGDQDFIWLYHPAYILRRGGIEERHSNTTVDKALIQYEETKQIILRLI